MEIKANEGKHAMVFRVVEIETVCESTSKHAMVFLGRWERDNVRIN
jgi:hypothetical protein